jgi:hypothetical protein
MKSLKICSIILGTIFFISCSQPLDFDPIDAYTVSPSIAAPLVFFTLEASNFTTTVAGAPIVTGFTEISDFKLFESSFTKQNVVQLDFEFEVNNEFNRDITTEISLLDANNNLIYRFIDLEIDKNNLNFKQKEIISIVTNQYIKNFTKVKVALSLDDKNIPIAASDLSKIQFKSGIIIHLEADL